MEFQKLYDLLDSNSMSSFSDYLKNEIPIFFSDINHGDYFKWMKYIDELPNITVSKFDFTLDAVTIGDKSDCSIEERAILKNNLMKLKPWRKGPFNIFGLFLDAEWQSNMKWNRLVEHIKPLENKLVLDIGCGNGYYGWRMLGKKAEYVLGLDPSLLFYSQFIATKKYLPDANIDYVPLGIESIAHENLCFDSVFSMGVIYHRRDPLMHLRQLFQHLKSSGELIIESLVIDSENLDVLIPNDRYAKMKNVWSIPSLKLLTKWLENTGFKNIKVINTQQTSVDEQRVTEWMEFKSLDDFLDIKDKNKTVEGYPAPIRTIIISEKP